MFKVLALATGSIAAPLVAECPVKAGSMDFWCLDVGQICIAGYTDPAYTCGTGQMCCHHYCMEGDENCETEVEAVPEVVTEVVPSNEACRTTPGTMDYWCQNTRNCTAGYVVDNTCADSTQFCCRHYCMEGDLACEEMMAIQ